MVFRLLGVPILLMCLQWDFLLWILFSGTLATPTLYTGNVKKAFQVDSSIH